MKIRNAILFLAVGSTITAGVLMAADAVKVGTKAGDAATAPSQHLMFGGDLSRNMVNLQDKFGAVQLHEVKFGDEVEKAADAKTNWVVDLGSRAYGGPTIVNGKVLVGTNNERPRNKRDILNPGENQEPIDKGIVMCFEEATGKFLWQAVFDKLPSGLVNDWPNEGVCSTPCVDGNRVYFATNRCTVVCLDLNGLADGNQGITTEKYTDPIDADIIWEFDMIKEVNVFPHNMTASSPFVVGDLVYLTTANGVDEGHINIPSPTAPSFIALDKTTGKLVWQKNYPGKKIMHGQWSNPVYGEIAGVRQVIFPGGDGLLYGLKPETGEEIWHCDCNPKESKYELGGTGTRSDFIGTPVVYKDKVYIGVGQDPEHFSGVGHFWCIDPAGKKGDISAELGDWEKKGTANPNSGVVWHYGGQDDRKFVPRSFIFGRTMSTACIVDDILYISELQGFIHCLDAKTGKKFWQYDTKGAIWGSPYYCDGVVYLATESGEVFAFKHTKTPKVIDDLIIEGAVDNRDYNKKRRAKIKLVEAEYLLGKTEFEAPVRSTPVVAGGIMYVMTEKSLHSFTPMKK